MTHARPPLTPEVPLKKVGATVLIGTTIEWYDFLLFSSAAALIFGPVFFPSSNPTTGLLLSLATFAVGYVARPIGSLVFGHFGDRAGRKQMLVLSLTLMGVATFAMGLIPSYESIGIAAPILLVALRIVQGIGVGGEWGGTMLTALEYAPPEKRGLYGALPQFGLPAGLALSSLSMIAVTALPDDIMYTWGWRIPFLLSGVLVLIGLYMRVSLEETPVFKQMQLSNDKVKVPLVEVFKTHPKELLFTTLFGMGTAAFFYTFLTYSVAYARQGQYVSSSTVQIGIFAAAVAMMIGIPYFGILGQRINRNTLLLISMLLFTVWIFVIFGTIMTGNSTLVVLVFGLSGALWALQYGPSGTYLAERFPARVRFTATAIPFHFGTMLGGSIAPLVGTALVARTGTVLSIEIYVAAFTLVGAAALLALRKSRTYDDTEYHPGAATDPLTRSTTGA
ncbi:MAG: MFS transporter [Demequina sp.]